MVGSWKENAVCLLLGTIQELFCEVRTNNEGHVAIKKVLA